MSITNPNCKGYQTLNYLLFTLFTKVTNNKKSHDFQNNLITVILCIGVLTLAHLSFRHSESCFYKVVYTL